jgi:hypothetical protein
MSWAVTRKDWTYSRSLEKNRVPDLILSAEQPSNLPKTVTPLTPALSQREWEQTVAARRLIRRK